MQITMPFVSFDSVIQSRQTTIYFFLTTFYQHFIQHFQSRIVTNLTKTFLSENFFVLRFYVQVYSPNLVSLFCFFVTVPNPIKIVGMAKSYQNSYQNCGNGIVGINQFKNPLFCELLTLNSILHIQRNTVHASKLFNRVTHLRSVSLQSVLFIQ